MRFGMASRGSSSTHPITLQPLPSWAAFPSETFLRLEHSMEGTMPNQALQRTGGAISDRRFLSAWALARFAPVAELESPAYDTSHQITVPDFAQSHRTYSTVVTPKALIASDDELSIRCYR